MGKVGRARKKRDIQYQHRMTEQDESEEKNEKMEMHEDDQRV